MPRAARCRSSTPRSRRGCGNAVNDDVRRPRNYGMQPPIIPHRIDGYQVDKNFNKCLDCHARGKTEFSQAVPVSETHYIDRSGKVLEQISTRRYFCNQCHVAQEAVAPLVDNQFQRLPAPAQPAAGRAGKQALSGITPCGPFSNGTGRSSAGPACTSAWAFSR